MVCCKSCHSLKVPGTWIEFDDLDSSVSHFIEESIEWNKEVTKIKSKSELSQLDPHKFRASISCEGDYQEINLTSELKTEVQIKFQVCQTCSRQAGGYYEAIDSTFQSCMNCAYMWVFTKDFSVNSSSSFQYW